MNSEESQLLQVRSAGSATPSIAYLFQKPEQSRPAYVWFCGFASEMGSLKAEELARWARDAGAGCLRFDYSGHGRSGGRFEDGTISAWLDDAAAVHSAALEPGGATVFVGSSMGAWIALLLARRLASEGMTLPKAMVLIAPAWDMTRLIWQRLPPDARDAIETDGVFCRPSPYGDGPYPITKKLIDDGEKHLLGEGPVPLDMPIRILHGCQDPDVPWRHSLDLMNVISGADIRLTLIKDGGHRLSRPQDLALLRSLLAEFL
jgi:alpha-beta hydrolase superfamily lysophospholipase